MNKERAIFQCMRHAMHMQKEFEDTKRLEFLKRQRQRHEELRAYLNATTPSGTLFNRIGG